MMCLCPYGAVPSLPLQLHTQLLPRGRAVHAKVDFCCLFVFFFHSLLVPELNSCRELAVISS